MRKTSGGNGDKKSFWSTLPGILTGIAAIITAVGGLLVVLDGDGSQVDPPKIEQFDFETYKNIYLLRWVISGAAQVTIEPDIGRVASTGTRHVYPSETTIYTLIAENDAGRVDATVEVLVEAEEKVPTITQLISSEPVEVETTSLDGPTVDVHPTDSPDGYQVKSLQNEQSQEFIRTNEYLDNSLAGCTPGSISARCSSPDACVDCGGNCYMPGSYSFSNGDWICSEGKWISHWRTNEYSNNSLAGCTPGSVSARCSSPDACVDCGGNCYMPGSYSFSNGDWICSEGKWRKK